MVKLLINNGVDLKAKTDIPHKSPLQLAAAGGHLEVMDELAKHGVDWKEKDDWGWTLLHEVAATGDLEAIQWVTARSNAMVNTADKLGRTPLLTALIAGAGAEAVKELIKNGEEVSEEDEVGRTCAEAAILYCSVAVIKVILEATKDNEDIELDIDKLILISEDHAQPDNVKNMISSIFG